MKEDTKRALEIIAPMAKELGIEVKADNTFLYCNGQAIGIGCNSAYATLTEFIEYAFWHYWKKWKREKMPDSVRKAIQRYWFTDENTMKNEPETLETSLKELMQLVRKINA